MLMLDHLVINTRFDTDAAERLFTELGFTVAPRGYHTLGSINHAIVFGEHYLELIGLPASGEVVREEILASPLGLDGLVWRTDDPAATAASLLAAGFEAGAPQVFSRPVELNGATFDARFATVRLAAGQLPGGRVYFCQHLTPELVFRAQWQSHPNQAYGLAALHLIVDDVAANKAAYDRLGEIDPAPLPSSSRGASLGSSFSLKHWTRAGFDAHFGAPAMHLAARQPRYGALTVRSPQWHAIGTRTQAMGLPTQITEQSTVIALPRFDTLLELIP